MRLLEIPVLGKCSTWPFTTGWREPPGLVTQGQCQRLLAMVAIGSALASPVCAHGGTETPSAGRQLATVHCSRCHGIDDERFILVPGALPLRDLKQRYPEELLAEALVANLRTAHLELSVTFSPAKMAALLSYLNSLW